MKIYVGNLPYNITDESLEAMFSEFGTVENIKLVMDRFSGRPKGFGFLEMPDNSEADKAMKALNGKQMDGRAIKVNQANPEGKKQKKTRRRGGGFR